VIQTAPAQQHDVEFESVACEICGSDERIQVVARPDLFLGGDTLYTMHECQGCGAIYQHPRPTADTIDQFYPSEYVAYTRSLKVEHWLSRLQRRYGLRKRCGIITRHVARGRLLDVGCATGDFLAEMQHQTGWSVIGVEPSHQAAGYARNEVGLDVVQGVLNEAPFADDSFDAITMWDVLEHVYDPRTVLVCAAQLLRPGGVLVINHPNVESMDRRVFGRYWCGFELPRHIYLFPPQLLQMLLAEHGLVEVERRCLYGSHAASATSLTFILESYFGKNRYTDLAQRFLFSKICRLMFAPLFWLLDQRRGGSNVTVVFKKTASSAHAGRQQ
jgi:2-polyprenyl-3-methyl-5-hydroxy-6-metoxy-1,4-benzoquinol methylase